MCDHMLYFFADAPMKKKKKKFTVCTALFGHQVQNNFFALIKKILTFQNIFFADAPMKKKK